MYVRRGLGDAITDPAYVNTSPDLTPISATFDTAPVDTSLFLTGQLPDVTVGQTAGALPAIASSAPLATLTASLSPVANFFSNLFGGSASSGAMTPGGALPASSPSSSGLLLIGGAVLLVAVLAGGRR